MQVFERYEAGESLVMLKKEFPELTLELNDLAESSAFIKQGRVEMVPSKELARKIIAGIALRPKPMRTSVFMSPLWRLAAPVGVGALAFLMVIVSRSVTPVAQDEMMATRTAEPMAMMAQDSAAENTASLKMAAPAAMEAAQAELELEVSDVRLRNLQIISLGLLVLLSAVVLTKHWLARVSARTP